MISQQFSIALGSAPGYRHWKGYRNNQDAAFVAERAEGLAAVVCDGCSAGSHSEVGAQLMCRFLAERALDLLSGNALSPSWDLTLVADRADFLVTLRRAALAFMRQTLGHLGGDTVRNTQDLMLFTVVGAILTDEVSFVFTLGDGIYSVNGHYRAIDEQDRPSYLAYALLDPAWLGGQAPSLQFVERAAVATTALQDLKLGTDGVTALDRRAEEPLADGTLQGGIAQFDDARYARLQTALQKRLIVIGPKSRRAHDDLTLIAIRRKEQDHG